MEFTDNFNQNGGGFLIDPNAPQQGGSFGVALGMAGSRNNAFFARPSAGAWHHYAFVFDTTAPAATQIIPYVDGKAVTYTKMDSGTGAGNFANSALNFMSRAGLGLFGRGALDEVAIYDRALSPGDDRRALRELRNEPAAGRTLHDGPEPGQARCQPVTFDGSTSSDPDGTIVKYEWDLDGNGTLRAQLRKQPARHARLLDAPARWPSISGSRTT